MRIFNVLLIAALVTTTAALAAPATSFSSTDVVQLAKRAMKLDQESKANLGVSIRALILLLQANQGPYEQFLRKDSLVRNGSWADLQELLKNGYAKTSIRTGIPDGSDPHTEWVVVKLTDKGKGIATSLKDPTVL